MTAATLRRIIRTQTLSPHDEKEIRALFAHRHGSLAVRKVDVSVDCDGLHANGTFEDARNGRACGMFLREVELSRGKVAIGHAGMKLNKAVQGHGWGRQWARGCEKRYRSFGAVRINIGAGDAYGGYVWALEGYELDGPHPMLWRMFKNRLSTLPASEPNHVSEEDCRRWRSEITAGRINSIQQVLALGRDESWERWGRRYWPGKILLMQTWWNGVKKLA